MFPITVTIHNQEQLDKVIAAFSETTYAKQKAISTEPKAQSKPKAKSESVVQEESPFAKDEDVQVGEITAKQLGDAILALAKNKGRDVALEILSRFNAKKVPEVKVEDYPLLLEAIAMVEEWTTPNYPPARHTDG